MNSASAGVLSVMDLSANIFHYKTLRVSVISRGFDPNSGGGRLSIKSNGVV